LDDTKLVDFVERVKQADGKLKNGEEAEFVDRELDRTFNKFLKIIMRENSYERGVLKTLIMKKKEEIMNAAKVDFSQRDKFVAQTEVNAYDFLKTIRFTISSRPAYAGFKKLSVEEFQELERLAENSPDALEKEMKELTDLQKRIADSMIFEEKKLLAKTGSLLWTAGKAIGKFVVETVISVGKFVKIIKSREEMSGERNERNNKGVKKWAKLDKQRGAIIRKAVKMIQDEKNQSCLNLKKPIHLAIYGEVERDGKMEKVIDGEEEKPQQPHIDGLMQDMQARLGAQALNSVINTKHFPESRARNFVFAQIPQNPIDFRPFFRTQIERWRKRLNWHSSGLHSRAIDNLGLYWHFWTNSLAWCRFSHSD
jgi:hypothetical protein